MKKHTADRPMPPIPPEKLQEMVFKTFPEQPIEFKGKIVAMTEIKTDAMIVKISLSDGTFLEMNCQNDPILFGRIRKTFELDKSMKVTIEEIPSS